MDIDEFLDKELQVDKKEVIEEKSEEETFDTEIAKEEKDTVYTEIPKEEENIVKHYFDLWKKVSEAKLKWDNNLYGELNKAENKVKGELNTLSSAVKRKKTAIKQLISKAISELKNKNYEAATLLYSKITDIRNTLPGFFIEEKQELNKEIFQLYDKLHDEVDSKFINDFNKSIAKISGLISNSFASIKIGQTGAAKKFYEDALDTYKTLPNGFLCQKIDLGNGLLELYKELSINTQIRDLRGQLTEKTIRGHKFRTSSDNLKLLSEIIKKKVEPQKKSYEFSGPKFILEVDKSLRNKTLLSKLVVRKLERAKINLKKGLYPEAKKNLQSVLKVDPNNRGAREMLNKIPIQY